MSLALGIWNGLAMTFDWRVPALRAVALVLIADCFSHRHQRNRTISTQSLSAPMNFTYAGNMTPPG